LPIAERLNTLVPDPEVILMRTKEIEKALKNLPASNPPRFLMARCLATIPAESRRARPLTWKEKLKMIAVRTGLAMVTSFTIAVFVATTQPGSPSGAAVFAASVEAMKKVPFYHLKDRSVRFWPEGGNKEEDDWYSGRWIESEIWFDAEHGVFYDDGGKPFMHQMRRDSADGVRHYERRIITQSGATGSAMAKVNQVRQLTDLAEMARLINSEVEPRLVSTEQRRWKGRKATVLTFLARPTSERATRGRPTVRTVVYVDPKTNLCLALQEFSRSQVGEEVLVRQAEFDFSRRPDPAIFDPRRVEAGAGSIKRQKGGPGVIVSP
jgi:hypothetical protein